MANKEKILYVCSACGYESPKSYGKCPSCSEWNTLEETVIMPEVASGSKQAVSGRLRAGEMRSYTLSSIAEEGEIRYDTGVSEFNRVLGGGLVRGSLVLLSGDPGIGKSTLLLQICEYLTKKQSVLYVSGEESAHQLKLRAARLGVTSEALRIMCETDAASICEYITTERPDIVIIDSVQTMSISEISSSPGSVVQVRECTSLFMRVAKSLEVSVIIVGHVNKDGNIAGPKVLEHIVDAVLYLEGERNLSYRILRAVKNRFGSTNEIGVFEMSGEGLIQVENPSQALIAGRPLNVSGTCITCFMEGTRPILAEVQGLATPSGFGNPRRMSAGFDNNRLSMLIAILEKRAGYFLGNTDCYINIVGGLRADEPASDLPVALALVSSLKDVIVNQNTIAFGEIGLAGELRSVSGCEQRISEAKRLGFKRCIVPKYCLKNLNKKALADIEVIGVRTIREAFENAVD